MSERYKNNLTHKIYQNPMVLFFGMIYLVHVMCLDESTSSISFMKIAMRFVNDMIMMQGLSNPKARSVLVHIVEPLQRQDMQGSHNLDHGLAAPAYGGCFGDVGIAGAAHWRRMDVALCMLISWCQFWTMISRTGGPLARPDVQPSAWSSATQ